MNTLNSDDFVNAAEEHLAGLIGLSHHVVQQLRFDRTNGQELVAVCLYARLIELSSACKVLLERNALLAIPMVLRSMFEADIDLTNCIRDADYVRNMQSSFLKEKLRLLREARDNTDNQFTAPLASVRDVAADARAVESELQQLRDDGHRPLSVFERAKRADRVDEYRSVYGMLCLDTHNNIASLEQHHVSINSERREAAVLFGERRSDFVAHVASAASILLQQNRAMCSFLDVTDVDMAPHFDEENRLRAWATAAGGNGRMT